jgi:catalase
LRFFFGIKFEIILKNDEYPLKTHRHRLGANYLQIPVNCPFKTRNYQRDGPQTYTDNQSGAPNYFPNSFSGPNHNATYNEPEIQISGDAKRYETGNDDNFSQVGIFWNNVLKEDERTRLVQNIAGHLINAADFLQQRAINNFTKCDPEYGRRLGEALNKLKSQSNNVSKK